VPLRLHGRDPVTAALLREAAALMRRRAEAATTGPWATTHISESAVANQHIIERWFVMGCFGSDPGNQTGPAAVCEYEPDGEHIASWHPAVALAVAGWLDLVARLLDEGFDPNAETVEALAVARAYLGRES